LIKTLNPYIGVEKFSHKAPLLGHEYENDDDDHGVRASAPHSGREAARAKIEPAIKKFQQECSGHTDSQACKEEHDALVKALNEFLSLVQNGFKVIDAHPNDASDADYQKQIAALRAKAQQHLDWGREQLAAPQ
jgi:hypothetical protein